LWLAASIDPVPSVVIATNGSGCWRHFAWWSCNFVEVNTICRVLLWMRCNSHYISHVIKFSRSECLICGLLFWTEK
jgi:hypothetical protein